MEFFNSLLDDWYRAYEKEFPKKQEVVRTVTTTLGELLAVLPEMEQTRWRKKSDFYSLFLVFARVSKLMPLSREGRKQCHGALIKFGNEADQFLEDPDSLNIPEGVKKYALAVERAASDLANRKERDTELSAMLSPIFDAERKAAGQN